MSRKKPAEPLAHASYLRLAIPFIFSTVTQPLLGAVDTAVVGKLANPAFIAGVSVGAVIFNTLYWLFGFLRVSTTAYSAQAAGMDDECARVDALLRPGVLALSIGLVFLLFQVPIFSAAMQFIQPDAEVVRYSGVYYCILIWGAPVVLLNYVMLGWLMGQERLFVSLLMQIGGNVLNIALDILFVYGYGMDVGGVAAATLISQFASFAVGVVAICRHNHMRVLVRRLRLAVSPGVFLSMLRNNADLMLRTVCVLVQINVFTAAGARFGTEVLSVNAIMYQMMMLVSYTFDGFANASSVFAGRARGARDAGLLHTTWRMSTTWCGLTALFLFCVCALGFGRIPLLFTDIPGILTLFEQYGRWVCAFPLVAWAGVSIYGIFTGTGDTGPVRDSTVFALLLFLAVVWALVPAWGNHGLWAAFMSFYLGRSIFLAPRYRSTFRKIGGRS